MKVKENTSRQHRGETASWVVIDRESKAVQFETFSRSVVEKLNGEKYDAIPIGDYLESLNGGQKS